MTHPLERSVLEAVAAQAEMAIHDVCLHHELERDLHLQPLDLVVIALRIEDRERLAFPFERLAERSHGARSRHHRATSWSARPATRVTRCRAYDDSSDLLNFDRSGR